MSVVQLRSQGLTATAVIFSLIIGLSQALICYEHDAQGHIQEVSNKAWNYCVLVPQTATHQRPGRLFGIGPRNDFTRIYDETFAVSSPLYKILSMCILEKYDFSPITAFGKAQPEFMFRCVCNYDKCNSEANFQKYLTSLEKDNA